MREKLGSMMEMLVNSWGTMENMMGWLGCILG